MVHCRQCGSENPKDSKFCKECGIAMIIKDMPGPEEIVKEQQPTLERPPRDDFGRKLGRDLDAVGKRLGREFSKIGKDIDGSFKRAGRGRVDWFEKRFGVFGPFLSGFIGFVIFILVVTIILQVAQESGNTPLTNFSDFIGSNLIVFVIIIILFSYISYLSKKYYQRLYKVQPIINAATAVIWLWIAAWILHTLYLDLGIQGLSTASSILLVFIPIVVTLIIAFGYVRQSWTWPKPTP